LRLPQRIVAKTLAVYHLSKQMVSNWGLVCRNKPEKVTKLSGRSLTKRRKPEPTYPPHKALEGRSFNFCFPSQTYPTETHDLKDQLFLPFISL